MLAIALLLRRMMQQDEGHAAHIWPHEAAGIHAEATPLTSLSSGFPVRQGKVSMPDLDLPSEYLLAEIVKPNCFEKHAVSAWWAYDINNWLNLMMQVGSNPAFARELLGADGKPMTANLKDVTLDDANLVKNQWCAAHNGTITMTAVKAMTKQQLIEEYEYICRRLEKDRLLSAQYNLFRPKPAITEPPSKRQRVEHASSQPDSVPAATTHTADDPDSAGGGSSNPAASATPMAGSAASNPAGGTFDAPDSADSSSPSNVLFESTSGGIHEFFLDSDEDEQIGLSRVAADPDSDDDVLAEIIFRGKSISGDGVVFVDKLPDDEIVDPRVKVETVTESAASPPRSRSKHLGWKVKTSLLEYKTLLRTFLALETDVKSPYLLETVSTFMPIVDPLLVALTDEIVLAIRYSQDMSNPLHGLDDSSPKTVGYSNFTLDSRSDGAPVSAACIIAAYFVSAATQSSCFAKIYLETWNNE
ncbi:hypothetical protein Tco_0543100 [Tanacetum coccineum]